MKGLCNHSIADFFFLIDLDSGVCYTCAKKKKGGLVLSVGFFVGLFVFWFFCAIVLHLTCGFQTKIKYYF